MQIQIVTPAKPGSRRGNRVTAERWERLLQKLGHLTSVEEAYRDEQVDLLIALHAGRSTLSIQRYRELHPTSPLVVAVTGTDIYGSEFEASAVSESLQSADRIVVLQSRTADDLPKNLHEKVRVVYQSAEPPVYRESQRDDCFEVAVVAHLRHVKDPFRAAEASRLLPPDSRIQIVHLGEAYSHEMAENARNEMAINPRYEWLGDLPHERTLSILARSRLMVLTSLSEGGPAVIAEALVSGVPILATRVAGCVGMLGDDYPGLFAVGDTQSLAELLWRAETDTGFYSALTTACARRRSLFEPEAELASWRSLLAELRFGDGAAS